MALRAQSSFIGVFSNKFKTFYSGILFNKRFLSSEHNGMATYEEVKDIVNHPEKYLIDVRSKDELAKTGVIPASINIPMSELETALNMDDNDFRTNFNRPKPTEETYLIFSCLAGGRAQRAADLAKSRGFTNVKPYLGSWTEWAQKEGIKTE